VRSLSDAAELSARVHERLCEDYRSILQNRQLVEFHEHVETMSERLLSINLLQPTGRVRRGVALGEAAAAAAAAEALLQPPQMRHRASDARAVGAQISALLGDLKEVHRGIGALVDGQLGELEAVLEATTRCTAKATSLVKYMAAEVQGCPVPRLRL